MGMWRKYCAFSIMFLLWCVAMMGCKSGLHFLVTWNIVTDGVSEWAKPGPGNQFVVVHVKAENDDMACIDISNTDFELVVDGVKYFSSGFNLVKPLTYVQVCNGGSTEGDILFEIPDRPFTKAEFGLGPRLLDQCGAYIHLKRADQP